MSAHSANDPPRFIQSWNDAHASGHGFKLALNQFAFMTHDQFKATSLGHVPSRRRHQGSTTTVSQLLGQTLKGGGGGFLGTFKRKLTNEELPASVDYRGTGADGAVKDQAFCGMRLRFCSCFGAACVPCDPLLWSL